MGILGHDRRRQLVVDKPFQYRATAVGVLYILVVIVCLSLLMLNMMRSVDLILIDRSPEMIKLYQSQMRYTLISLGVCLIAISSAWVLFSLWRTHKIAGPAYAMRRTMSMIADGKLPTVRALRKHDELQAVGNELKRMADNLRAREEAELTRLKSALETGAAPDQIKDLIRQKEERLAS